MHDSNWGSVSSGAKHSAPRHSREQQAELSSNIRSVTDAAQWQAGRVRASLKRDECSGSRNVLLSALGASSHTTVCRMTANSLLALSTTVSYTSSRGRVYSGLPDTEVAPVRSALRTRPLDGEPSTYAEMPLAAPRRALAERGASAFSSCTAGISGLTAAEPPATIRLLFSVRHIVRRLRSCG